MRRLCGICLTVVGVAGFVTLSANADQTPGRVVNRNRPTPAPVRSLSDRSPTPVREARPDESPGTTVESTTGTATPESAAKERQILGRVRGYQALLDREEKLLAQRMAYAAKLRQHGLEKEDKRLLDKAEDYERRSLAAYLASVKQFEKAQLSAGSQQPAARTPTSSRATPQATPRVQGNSQSRSSSSHDSSSHSRRMRRPSYGRR